MTSAGDRIIDELREAAVRTLPLARGQSLVEDRGEQRVREPNGSVLELDHLLAERRIECALLDAHAAELGDGQSCVRGSEHERLMRRAGEAVEPRGHELLQPLGNRQRLGRIRERAL